MVRPLRVQYPNAFYHVTSRGNERKDIFEDENDRWAHIRLLRELVEQYGVVIHSWVQMTNHYHLLIETPDSNLALAMRHLNGVYTQRYNRRHHRVGHLFQGRFKAFLVDKESYLKEVCRYMVLNPVRAGLVVHPKAWKWSNFRSTAGYENPEPGFECDWLLSLFRANRRNAREAYRKFVNEGVLIKESPFEKAVGSLVLGGAEFQASVRELVKDRKTGEFKNEQVELTKPDPEQIIRAMAKLYNVNSERILKVDRRRNEARDLTAWCMRRLGCLGLSKVGNHLGVQYSTAGHAVSRMNKKMAKDPGLLKKVQKAIFQT